MKSWSVYPYIYIYNIYFLFRHNFIHGISQGLLRLADDVGPFRKRLLNVRSNRLKARSTRGLLFHCLWVVQANQVVICVCKYYILYIWYIYIYHIVSCCIMLYHNYVILYFILCHTISYYFILHIYIYVYATLIFIWIHMFYIYVYCLYTQYLYVWA